MRDCARKECLCCNRTASRFEWHRRFPVLQRSTSFRLPVNDTLLTAHGDALGIPAALHRPAVVYSRCEQSGEPLRLQVSLEGPEPSTWLFHCLVPTAKWWDDIVFT